ncbi:MAG: sensor histidine kinase [Eubacteriales bacterium]|nr:sensor histidine kinase [Eubacteriales bacterium]
MKKPASISRQMRRLVYAFSALTAAVLLIAAATLLIYQTRYRGILHNLTTASEFNQDFKTDVDLKMYYFVVESRYSEGLPLTEIRAAQALARELRASTTHRESLQAITSVLDLSENLEAEVCQIRDTESYDQRQIQLENNVYVITDLIREYMSNYLYSEAVQLNTLQQQMGRQLLLEMVLLALGAGAVFALLTRHALRLGQSIAQPIVHLSRRVQQIGGGDLEVHTPVASDVREVSTLSEGVEQMAQRMGQLIQETTEKQQSLRRMELALLQAQINPHFLYNTMDTIIWLMEAEKNEEAVEMVSNLSSFFRHSLSKGEDVITVDQEAGQVRSYLQIQQVRYKDILTYTIDIAPELREVRLPKLTLQPLVENALYHGIKLKRAKGVIAVTGRLEKGEALLQVRDDGVGMSRERLAELRSAMDRGERVGFGLSTVHERLKLFFGPDYGLEVESREGLGTVITARIPLGKEI